MGNDLQRQLENAAVTAFEELAFSFLMPELGPSGEGSAGGAATAAVEFEARFHGVLEVTVGDELLEAVAINMLGEEAIPSRRQQLDALGEIGNVICGHLLPAAAGAEEVFAISPPIVRNHDGSPTKCSAEPVAEVELPLDQGRATVRLFLRRSQVPTGG